MIKSRVQRTEYSYNAIIHRIQFTVWILRMSLFLVIRYLRLVTRSPRHQHLIPVPEKLRSRFGSWLLHRTRVGWSVGGLPRLRPRFRNQFLVMASRRCGGRHSGAESEPPPQLELLRVDPKRRGNRCLGDGRLKVTESSEATGWISATGFREMRNFAFQSSARPPSPNSAGVTAPRGTAGMACK